MLSSIIVTQVELTLEARSVTVTVILFTVCAPKTCCKAIFTLNAQPQSANHVAIAHELSKEIALPGSVVHDIFIEAA
jgi:hypothetical protein